MRLSVKGCERGCKRVWRSKTCRCKKYCFVFLIAICRLLVCSLPHRTAYGMQGDGIVCNAEKVPRIFNVGALIRQDCRNAQG